ncbi:hypothetical protein GFS31_17710 [Leptolyngbya sp. BL0902]|uniref:tetratricopeptide repeat protein n=1 Tax=Leptolyngbya sp. BL0902 TaxID=1115757 RepID=UPI0018E90304|nr:tetratricopeptide repeat protein [Leptolyngbya sp. BL0902]QQE65086.1 hypothetical protein GFS31_17710 [Leptolyngbya sp. BL0902]
MTLAKTAKQIAADPEAQYQALRRSLRRRKGFGLLFIQASPAKAQELLQRLQTDLPQKTIGTLTLTEPITNLYNLVAERPDLADLNILFIQGIEKSLEADIKPGYGGEGDYYNLDTLPPLLSHLNQQRDNFRDHFGHLCFVFVVPPFALKYFLRRAADFLDWRSAIFTFADTHAEERKIQARIQVAQGEETKDSNLQALIYFLQGNAQNETGDYKKAIASYDAAAAVAVIPEFHGLINNNKGIVLEILGQHEAAISCYDAALTINPNNHEALNNKANTLSNLGYYEAAITTYDAALAIKPDLHEALNNKGIALEKLGQYEAAIAAYDQVLAIKPDKHNALYNKGIALDHLGQYESAIAAFDQALAIEPDDHEALNNKGIALGKLGQHEAAIATFDQALAIEPDYHEAWDSKGYALAMKGCFDEAIICFDKAIEINPQYANAIYNKAFTVSRTCNLDEALELLRWAIALDPKYRTMAKTDTDFDPIRHDDRFRALVEG